MVFEQAGESQPEVKSYDETLQDDVRAAFTEVTTKSAEPADLKPAGADLPADLKTERTAAERARDEQGRFAKADEKTIQSDKEVVQDKSGAVPTDRAVPGASDKTQPALTPDQLSAQAAKPNNPPIDWEPKAKAQWDRLPQVVRDNILKSTATGSDPSVIELKPYIERAKQSGQSLANVLQSYTGMEAMIRKDPAGGMIHLSQNLGLTQHQAGQLFADLAQRLGVMPQGGLQQQPADGQDAPQGFDPRTLAPVLDPFQQRLNTLESHIRQQNEALQSQRLSAVSVAIEKFRSTPEARYFSNLEPDIARILDTGIVPRTGDPLADLKAAYDTACRLNPEISEILLAERVEKDRAKAEADARQAAEKARQASRSVTGSPSPGASPGTARRAQGKSYDEDLHNDVLDAIRSVSGRA